MAEVLNLTSVKPQKKRNVKKRRVEMTLLSPAPGSKKKRKRVGRGHATGSGKTSGRGHKGQKARTGYSHKVGFEGGQNPLYKRVPKRGFTNIFKEEYQVINVWLLEKHGISGEVSLDHLKEKKLIRRTDVPVKLLGQGEISNRVILTVHAASAGAMEKIKKAGGEVKLIGAGS
jgi:large subunit ribosomal protein L15